MCIRDRRHTEKELKLVFENIFEIVDFVALGSFRSHAWKIHVQKKNSPLNRSKRRLRPIWNDTRTLKKNKSLSVKTSLKKLNYQATFCSSGVIQVTCVETHKLKNKRTKIFNFIFPHQKRLIIDQGDLQTNVEKWTKPQVKGIVVCMLKTVLFVVLSADAGSCFT